MFKELEVSRNVNQGFLELYRDYLGYKGHGVDRMWIKTLTAWYKLSRREKYTMSQYMAIEGLWGPVMSEIVRLFDGTVYFR